MRPGKFLCLFALVLPFLAAAVAKAEETPRKVAVFDFELIDTSGGTIPEINAADKKRLVLISGLLRRKLGESEKYEVVDIAPAAEMIDDAVALYDCNGCDADIAAFLGADLALTAYVHKVSNLILSINVFIRDVATGKMIEVHNVDIRGNTDKSWTRGISWMLRHRLLKEPKP